MSRKLSSSEKVAALRVVCPRCGVWVRESCQHTKGRKIGEKCDPHPERVKLSNINLSPETKRKIKEVEDAEPREKKHKKDKLSPEQRMIVDSLLEKVSNLGKHLEFLEPVTVGPMISTYRLMPIHKTRVAHLEGMMKDFAVAVKADTLVVKRIPGEAAVGVFVPNSVQKITYLSETLPAVLTYMQKHRTEDHLPIPLNFGVTAHGESFIDDLTEQPHILIAGSTGAGKTTLANDFLLSMLWVLTPRELQLVMSDTKKVDIYPYYKNIPHLVRPIATDVYETMQALDYLRRETQRRLDILSHEGCRNLHVYNQKHPDKTMPYLVGYIDELADIMGESVDRTEGRANSEKLGAIVGRSRAAGIYIMAGTQRPSVNIVKGSIKANFPSRVAFKLPSVGDSQTVLKGVKGAECLMKCGDMFYSSSNSSELRRLHAPYAKSEDVKMLIEQIIQKEEVAKENKRFEEAERIAIQQEANGHPITVVSSLDRKPN